MTQIHADLSTCIEWQPGAFPGYLSGMRIIPIFAAAAMLSACADKPEEAVPAVDSTAPALSAIPTLPKVGPTEVDSGPPVKLDTTAAALRLVMDPHPGDQISALQPPFLQTSNGRRLEFRGSAVTKDSLYFVGDVVVALNADALPLDGTLTTSYCRAGEKVCRTASRVVSITR